MLAEKILAKVKDNKINCKDALAIAYELKIKPSEVGDYCNQNKIKVVNCQLGCFK
ncbi:MAG: hypothetical protein JXA60_00520 [Candidatus Coatesbacteria bacterium]|nr:hypothetical protein [Candidatus Coatesbacteria bacterium]